MISLHISISSSSTFKASQLCFCQFLRTISAVSLSPYFCFQPAIRHSKSLFDAQHQEFDTLCEGLSVGTSNQQDSYLFSPQQLQLHSLATIIYTCRFPCTVCLYFGQLDLKYPQRRAIRMSQIFCNPWKDTLLFRCC